MTPTQQQASRLADLWHRLSTQHVALGCACSMAGVSVTLEDFERDIGDYLWAESERLGETAVVALLLASGPMATQAHPIRDCLRRLQEDDADATAATWLLARLTKTLASYAALHGPSQEAPLFGGSRQWGQAYRT
jgi:hypothetical protein